MMRSLTVLIVLVLTCNLYGQENHELIIDSLKSQCKRFSQAKKYDSAFATAQKLKEFAIKKQDTALLINSYFRSGFYSKKNNSPITALVSYNLSIAIDPEGLFGPEAISCYQNKASLLSSIGDYKESQRSAIYGIELAKKTGDTIALHELYNLLAIAAARNIEYEVADKAYKDGLLLTTNTKDKARILNNIGVLYKHQEKYFEAIKMYDSVLKSLSFDSPKLRARTESNLGFALTQINDRSRALPLLNKALNTRQEIEDNNGVFATYIHLINYYKDEDNLKAKLYAKKALAIATQKTKSPDSEKEALSHLVSFKTANEAEIARYVFLVDSLNRAKQNSMNDYTAVKFQTTEKELEIAKQKEEIATSAKELAEKNKREIVIVTLLLSAIIVGYVIFRKFQKEKKDRKIIEVQKNKIELLQKELHHRLKNNLSFIDLFIGLAKDKFKDPVYLEKLNDLQNRISSMFVVHQQLFNSDDVTLTNAKKYINTLLNNIKQTYPTENITFKTDIDTSSQLEANTSLPIGLIVNEFVTNSLKYAFTENKKGAIFISLTEINQYFLLKLTDDGIGLPLGFKIENLNSFGIDTMRLLAEEHDGTFKIESKKGVQVLIKLPKKAA